MLTAREEDRLVEELDELLRDRHEAARVLVRLELRRPGSLDTLDDALGAAKTEIDA